MTSKVTLILLAAIIALLFYAYLYCRKLAKQLKSEQKINHTMLKIIKTQQKDQEKIAMALHDKLGANLSALHLYIDIVKQHIPEKTLNIIKQLLIESIQETRNMIKKNRHKV